MKEYCILYYKKMSIFALSFCEVTNKLMPKAPMGKKTVETIYATVMSNIFSKAIGKITGARQKKKNWKG